ncbi:MAG TPA: response regulator transcription factor [Acidimicrobiia bacterium]|nr:response regulator transcription factor [Acidimicrobiia bacterium]
MNAVLLVEDDRTLRRALRASFRNWKFDVTEAGSGEEALSLASGVALDLVVLDLTLPGIDGLETLRHLRTFSDVPVVVLTVRDSLRDKVAALDSGADDYVVKPFEPDELLARSRAHLRRASAEGIRSSTVRAGDVVIDMARRRVTWRGEPVPLTPTELRLLEVLLQHRGRLVTREQLLRAVWGSQAPSDRGRIRAFMVHLRRKLHDDAARPRVILTEPGIGYRWIGDDEELDD